MTEDEVMELWAWVAPVAIDREASELIVSRPKLVELLAELHGRGAAIERVRALCERADAAAFKAANDNVDRHASVTTMLVRLALDEERR